MDLEETISYIPLGGVSFVTRNMHLYEYKDQILIVDCGIGFADETMLGVDLVLPDITYLQKTNKKIIGMVLTHGHEDHIGALPYVLPQLQGQEFPIYATPLTAALANEKLKEYGVATRVQTVQFTEGEKQLGNFKVSFVRVTHSVPDSSNIFIQTPVGNFYHASDFKFDLTPQDGKRSDFQKMVDASKKGVLALMSDCLRAQKEGYTASESALSQRFLDEMQECKGKFIMTTYSSNISRLNQAINAAEKLGRQVCFIGRSLIKAKEVAAKLELLHMKKETEIQIDEIKNYPENKLMLLVAGSQGQESSALTRIVNGEHREVKISADDMVVFSADPIPGNEVSVHGLIDTMAKTGARIIYSEIRDDFHVSGHGSSQDVMLMMSLIQAKYLVPISGTYRQMIAYKHLAKRFGYDEKNVFLLEEGQELIFSKSRTWFGKKNNSRNVYVDQISGEEVESFVLRDRQKLSEGAVVIVLVEIDSATGEIVGNPDIIVRGFVPSDASDVTKGLLQEVRKGLGLKKGKVTNWVYVRKNIEQLAERYLFKKFRRRPLVLPIVIEA